MSNSLLPPGSSALERRLAQACSGISDLNVPLRDLWNPWKCPAKFLPYLAWAFSVDRWEETWTETAKRQAVSDAFWIHQRKGTVAAVKRVIEGLGYSMTLEEWWKVADPAGTFRLEIDLNEIGITESMIYELERIIGDAKPVSRHISQLTLSASVYGAAYIGVGVVDGETISVYPPGYEPDDSIYFDGTALYDEHYHFSGK
ncbi:phage tail protein I [Klebsiella pneumoniae]|uniref:phage tail protein I n=1 Tax=Klebsiella pneumoniae TaxID=573 RepID=UPI000E2B069F|nr:phage tail protein I [Klebsiella pneumoniae]HBQ5833494.1 phage tail protein I [Klebsiella pneumoniae subsp. pneumoniae]HDG8140116.1 phage tail protein I [Klebsiella quasipneumoniae subsp. quasipneumoniae]EIW9291261.1 phage tail protein I [Klebsiella pneumoniae]MCD5895974.1 phage tail protein I [Klebsiella pneumoniae]MDM9060064.1 phage tail protein I [Klebsiella pneumoniae]